MNKTITIKKVQKGDLKYFLKWWKDKEIIKLTSGIYEKSNEILGGYFFDLLNSEKDRHYLILLNKKAIGHIAIIYKNKNTYEINIVIGEKKYWGKGYGETVIKKIIRIAFGKLKYKKAYLEVRPDNNRAIRVYEKCGFKKAGIKKYPKNKYQPIVMKMELKNK